MKISVNTETEELSELRSVIAIIEDAIKRRESPDDEEQTTMPLDTEEPSEDFQQETQAEEIESQPEPRQEFPPEVDLSALSTSDYGERVENRTMNLPSEEAPTPKPQKDNKSIVRDIIQSLKDKSHGNPIQMQDIINLAREKNIEEEKTRNLVNELQNSSST